MDRRPTMETRPPVLIDAVVRALIPPACREHVVGDLWERYRSPSRFVLDAAGTVPFVVASQIRRTSTLSAVFIQAFVLFVAFAASSRGSAFAVAPLLAGLVALVLRDAYKTHVSISAKQVTLDMLVGAGGVMVSQALLALAAPQLMLPLRGYAGGVAAFGMLSLLRLQNPRLGAIPNQAVVRKPANLDALVAEVRLNERMGNRARRIEIAAGIGLALVFIQPLRNAPNIFLCIGWALATAYVLYVVAIMLLWKRPHPMPDGLGFGPAIEHYRRELVRQHKWVRTMWLWYFLPLVPGLTFVVAGSAVEAAGRGRPFWPGAVMMVVLMAVLMAAHRTTGGMARKLQSRIEALASVEER
jgi:hypothetical protein